MKYTIEKEKSISKELKNNNSKSANDCNNISIEIRRIKISKKTPSMAKIHHSRHSSNESKD